MHVGLLVVDCWVPSSQSLKDKRRVISSAVDRLKRRFNVAACEVEYQDQWQRVRLAIVTVNTDRRMLESTLGRILKFIELSRELEVIGSETENLL
ncbi:MAG: DUF503 domain-containing protein [bacterium]